MAVDRAFSSTKHNLRIDIKVRKTKQTSTIVKTSNCLWKALESRGIKLGLCKSKQVFSSPPPEYKLIFKRIYIEGTVLCI